MVNKNAGQGDIYDPYIPSSLCSWMRLVMIIENSGVGYRVYNANIMIMHIVQIDLTSQLGRYPVENSAAGSRDACGLTSPPSTSTGGPFLLSH